MNQKVYGGLLAVLTCTLVLLPSCGSSSSKTSVVSPAVTNYSFYLNGLEVINDTNGQPNYYALAGSVAIDANGKVLSGEQDYNDGFGLTSPQPAGDSITGGSLVVDATGQGTMTLITSNSALGSAGTETLGVQFVNANHALIIQFDGSATSSGGMDLQTLPSTLSGGYAFTLSGVDGKYNALTFGGVFSVSGGAVSGTVDANDSGAITLAGAFNGTLTAADKFGRGQIGGVNINGTTLALNYYVVGAKAIRIINVDATDSALGSAFGQGTNATAASNASLGESVFGVEANSWGFPLYATVGMLTPHSGSGKFTGVGDSDEEGNIVRASPISGTYAIASNGYGSLTITNAGLLGTTLFGLYVTDPTLNLIDPNSTNGGGGALVLELGPDLQGGTGVVIPQTDTATSSFTGSYAFGAQAYNDASAVGWEFDHVGRGEVAGDVLTGTGLVSDEFGFFSATPAVYTAVPFSGTASPDVANPGRYTMVPLDLTAISGSPSPFSVAIYQASGGLLFWIDEDSLTLSLGTLQQQPTTSPVGPHAKSAHLARTPVPNINH